MSLIKTPAIVLGTRHLGEADKWVTLFTQVHGKVTGTAKGARRVKSRFGGSLEPFTHCQVILFQKTRDSLHRIQQVDILRSFRELREDLSCIMQASRVASLTSAMVPEGEANPTLFNVLLETLTALQNSDGDLTSRLFEIRLLKHSGYQPRLELEYCLRCRGKLSGMDLFFSPTAGGIICNRCKDREAALPSPITRGAVAFFRQVLRMPPRLAGRLKATPSMKDELKNLLEIYFDHLLERPSTSSG